MNDMLVIMKKELARFFGDRRLVTTVVILPGAMIFLVYSLMGTMMQKEFRTGEDFVATAYAVNLPAEISGITADMPIEWIPWDGSEDVLENIGREEKGYDVALVFPEDFSEKVAAYDGTGPAPAAEIYYNSAGTYSHAAYTSISYVLEKYEESLVNKFDVNAGEEGSKGPYDLAPENGAMGKLLSGMLPLLIMTFIFSGVQGVAPESIAGEKERGTIATLLVTPIRRSSLALGKVVSLSLIALLSGASSFLGTIASLPKMLMSESEVTISYSASDYAVLLAVIVSSVFLLTGMTSIASVRASSVKEATTIMAPLMVCVMVVSLLPMLGMEVGGRLAFLIPLYNSAQAMSQIFGFQADVPFALLSVCVNFAATGILVFALTKMFGNERVMFGR